MTPFPLPVTAWTAVLLGATLLWLTVDCIRYRRSKRIVYGDGGDKVMLKKMRGQANAAEQIPISLILLGLVEAMMPGAMPVVLGVLLVAGRVVHGAYFAIQGLPFQMRMIGMALTFVAQIVAMVALVIGLLG